jgi:hypothetical protein
MQVIALSVDGTLRHQAYLWDAEQPIRIVVTVSASDGVQDGDS